MFQESRQNMKVVGYVMSEKKYGKFCMESFHELCRKEQRIELRKIDLKLDLEDQGPFNLIFHKVTDLVASVREGNIESQRLYSNLKNYLKNHPEITVIDSLESIERLCHRLDQLNMVREIIQHTDLSSSLFVPNYVELLSTDDRELNKTMLSEAGVNFPFVSKPSLAHGTYSHLLAVVVKEDGLDSIHTPCVAQQFVNHQGILYKLYMIGNKSYLIQRPSIKDINCKTFQESVINFHTHQVSKKDSSSTLNQVDCNRENCSKAQQIIEETIQGIVQQIIPKLGLNLVGLDIILDVHSGKYGIIDVNEFPGYDGVVDKHRVFMDFLLDKLQFK